MSRPLRHVLTTLLVLGFAALGAATSSPDEGSSSGSTSTGTSESATANLNALEAHLARSQNYGEGPRAQQRAAIVRDMVEPGDAIAVRVTEGTPRRIVVLVRFQDGDVEGLRDLSARDRRDQLDGILTELDAEGLTEGADVGIGIRGTIFYGAVATRRLGQAVQYDTSAVANTAVLNELLAPAAPAAPGAAPAPTGQAPAAPTGPYASVLTELNDLCGDVWCEGEHDYTFTSLACEGTTCQLGIDVRDYDENTDALGAPAHHTLQLTHVTAVTDRDGMMTQSFNNAVNAAINAFEGA